MQNQIEPRGAIKIGEIFKESFSLYKANFRTLVAISFLGSFLALIDIALGRADWTLVDYSTRLHVLTAKFIVSLWAHAALIFATARIYQQNNIGIKEAYIKTFTKRTWRFIGVQICYYLIFVAGLLLLLIPGFYLGTIFSLAGVAIIIDNRGFLDSFKSSKDLIQGYFWPVFGICMILNIVDFSPCLFYVFDVDMQATNLLFQGYGILVQPFIVAASLNLYFKLKKSKNLSRF